MQFYETQSALSQYLLFHYGEEKDLMPFSFGPKEALHFPARIAQEAEPHPRALDLGCAVGRSSFELTKTCTHVTAVDYSSAFIDAACAIQANGQLEYSIEETLRTARLPDGARPERVEFHCADAMDYVQNCSLYDLVLASNLLCRLPKPRAFLERMAKIVAPEGELILATPFSWLEEYTPRSEWLQKDWDAVLRDSFELQRSFDTPFLIREHARKYQWCATLVTVWRRKKI